MHMRRRIAVLLCLAAVFLLAGCGARGDWHVNDWRSPTPSLVDPFDTSLNTQDRSSYLRYTPDY